MSDKPTTADIRENVNRWLAEYTGIHENIEDVPLVLCYAEILLDRLEAAERLVIGCRHLTADYKAQLEAAEARVIELDNMLELSVKETLKAEAKLKAVFGVKRYNATGLNYDCTVILAEGTEKLPGKLVYYDDIQAIIKEQDK